MDQRDYFSILRAAFDLRGKHVLEIGGAVPVAMVEGTRVGSWTALDISSRRLEDAGPSQHISNLRYKTINADVADLEERDKYDLVYSTNCFEHVGKLGVSLEKIYAALKENGILFALFAPIWTSPVGHHAYLPWKGRVLTFNDGVLPNWYHLTHEEDEMHRFVKERFDGEAADYLCRCTYRGNDINRLLDSDYEAMIARYPYRAILRYRIRSRLRPDKDMLALMQQRYPGAKDFSTLGYFWVLKKGIPTVSEVARFFLGGTTQILYRKFLARRSRSRC